ncbi:MAG: aminopeptidase P family protein [Marinosulfonomonas sp.]
MFQTFDVTTQPKDGPPRLALLRAEISRENLDGYLVPRADAHQGEYVADCDARLSWLTGFTGSAGFCAVLKDVAGVFIDGRYRVQVRAQVDETVFTPVHWPETGLADWLKLQLPDGGHVGFDPWLHTKREIDALEKALAETGIELVAGENLVDRIWTDRPGKPDAKITDYPIEFAGKSEAEKRSETAEILQTANHKAAVLTAPDSIAWLLNLRGTDLPCVPVALAFAILYDTGHVSLFIDPAKASELPTKPDIYIQPQDQFVSAMQSVSGPVRVDPASAPLAVTQILTEAEVDIAYAQDPCVLPKACKNPVEIAGAQQAHLRDAAAMVEFLTWVDKTAPKGGLTEIDVVRQLEDFRRATNVLQDISFETIAGTGPNGAIVHYRVTEDTNRTVQSGDLLLVDSGGQYFDGTTDITRTIAVGAPTSEQITCFTHVLRGMIAISRIRFPKGVTGAHLDAMARAPLWMAGMDYDHGTGHGVGSYLSVHEGPQRLSRLSDVALQSGMILSNEPGYYREGAFGIRIENLLVVQEPAALPDGDAHRQMHSFLTLTYVPIDRRLIDNSLLSTEERAWVDAYHKQTFDQVKDRVSPEALEWLQAATAPL